MKRLSLGAKTSTATKDGYLTADELSYWDAHFKVDEESVPSIRTHSSAMLSLKEKVSVHVQYYVWIFVKL